MCAEQLSDRASLGSEAGVDTSMSSLLHVFSFSLAVVDSFVILKPGVNCCLDWIEHYLLYHLKAKSNLMWQQVFRNQ